MFEASSIGGGIEDAPAWGSGQDRQALVRPLISDRADLASLLLGDRDAGTSLRTRTEQVMQVVADVPAALGDSKFDPVRNALTPECRTSARAYLELIAKLDQSVDVGVASSSPEALDKSDAYDRHCLTPLGSVPSPIRQVTGILTTTGGAPFCSATAVGPTQVLTARHCFFHPATGEPLAEFDALRARKVSFRALSPHAGSSVFTLRAGSAPGPVAGFGPSADFMLLDISFGALENFASLATAPQSPAAVPVPTWIVGVNSLVGDVRSARPATAFVRASSPSGCSVVRVPATGCLIHSCQTAAGTSGAGVLQARGAGRPVLVGIHVGSGVEAAACGVDAPVGATLNIAVAVTQAMLNP